MVILKGSCTLCTLWSLWFKGCASRFRLNFFPGNWSSSLQLKKTSRKDSHSTLIARSLHEKRRKMIPSCCFSKISEMGKETLEVCMIFKFSQTSIFYRQTPLKILISRFYDKLRGSQTFVWCYFFSIYEKYYGLKTTEHPY